MKNVNCAVVVARLLVGASRVARPVVRPVAPPVVQPVVPPVAVGT